MDTNPTHDGVRMHEGKCKDWKDGLEFGSFAVQWMPNVDGEDISCHESCDLLVYKEKHCGRKERSMIKEWPQLFPIYAIQRVNDERPRTLCHSFELHNVTAKGKSVELHCGPKWFDYPIVDRPLN
ncbi:hypothetical protein CB0940_11983 [Cercospora beticola]|uniref:Uncharacterized protein n=1 Tax=Cercospora beticola TaxID=122368 RepID=A0A2G5IEL4_CERBT|nr:hypothetical protein CB0940_11983 [Cercospora beticola]PIB03219.1 hypothetical protein CB0940_11983 [Cercospora beticola]WPB04362.1 hypothetical protein RHO25_009008 [Cercospora beticola]